MKVKLVAVPELEMDCTDPNVVTVPPLFEYITVKLLEFVEPLSWAFQTTLLSVKFVVAFAVIVTEK
ncbi:hypothetical protein [Flaviaesturariibacter aridisoli]|uniref:Uncharacterized protein n=1 Tax=Flaviaesturariibacter aridisoli TaxID=2545761 RepID=A0A4R4DWH8_9BACT|nr:hypothetical protein [Flaviaesturariibacter aridisoli]TCZ65851.1 hypothetical protein E0486_16950 [Flaviaesturariibacter aridisoli]